METAKASPYFGGLDRTRRAKIVATLGPSCSTLPVFRQLVRAGLDVARLNFSHGSHEQKAELIRMVRQVAKEENKPICILADLQGTEDSHRRAERSQARAAGRGQETYHHSRARSKAPPRW